MQRDLARIGLHRSMPFRTDAGNRVPTTTDVGIVTASPPFSDSSLLDNAPTVGNVLPVFLVALAICFTVSEPWWICFVPDFFCCFSYMCILPCFFCCGCFRCLPDEEEVEVEVPVHVTLRFARSALADESFLCSEARAEEVSFSTYWWIGVLSANQIFCLQLESSFLLSVIPYPMMSSIIPSPMTSTVHAGVAGWLCPIGEVWRR